MLYVCTLDHTNTSCTWIYSAVQQSIPSSSKVGGITSNYWDCIVCMLFCAPLTRTGTFMKNNGMYVVGIEATLPGVTPHIAPASSLPTWQSVLRGCWQLKMLDSFPVQLTLSRMKTEPIGIPNVDLWVATPPTGRGRGRYELNSQSGGIQSFPPVYPNCLQTTEASMSSQWSSQTRPHSPLRHTSTLPILLDSSPLCSLTS